MMSLITILCFLLVLKLIWMCACLLFNGLIARSSCARFYSTEYTLIYKHFILPVHSKRRDSPGWLASINFIIWGPAGAGSACWNTALFGTVPDLMALFFLLQRFGTQSQLCTEIQSKGMVDGDQVVRFDFCLWPGMLLARNDAGRAACQSCQF